MVSFFWNVLVSLPILLLAVSLIARWLKASGVPLRGISAPNRPDKCKPGDASKRETTDVFVWSLLFRVLIFLVVSIAAAAAVGKLDGQSIFSVWEKWDAFHYVRLVGQGYAGYAEGGQHFFLVFYPLYVWLVRPIALLLGNTLAAGLLVSSLCYAGGCAYLYRLAFREYGRAVAWRAVLFLSVFPFSFFFGGMMTEGLFLLTTTAGLYHIRRHQWLAAGLWGILAAMTRMHGLFLVGAAFVELIQTAQPFTRIGEEREKSIKYIFSRLPLLMLPMLGTLAYLGLNYVVDGNPFAFLGHQQVRWGQGSMWISQVLEYLLRSIFTYGNMEVQLQIWLPEFVLFIVFFALLWYVRGRHRSMFTLYAFACLFFNYSLASLLSAGRYLSCAVPFFIFLACLTEKRPRLTALLAGGMTILFAGALTIYLTGGQIM